MATLPSRVPMVAILFVVLRLMISRLTSQCDDGVAGEGDRAVRERDGKFESRAPLAVDVVDRGDLPVAVGSPCKGVIAAKRTR